MIDFTKVKLVKLELEYKDDAHQIDVKQEFVLKQGCNPAALDVLCARPERHELHLVGDVLHGHDSAARWSRCRRRRAATPTSLIADDAALERGAREETISEMLYLNPPYFLIDGVSIFPDHADRCSSTFCR